MDVGSLGRFAYADEDASASCLLICTGLKGMLCTGRFCCLEIFW